MRLRVVSCLTALVFALSASMSAWAQGANASAKAAPAAAAKSDPRAEIVKKIDGIKLEDVRLSAMSGIYEISRGSEIAYVSGDGRFAIFGDMINLDTDVNLSEERRRGFRKGLLDSVPENEMLVYSPKDPKYTITVFTDIDCGYCQRLHSQMADYNRLGIRVRYLFYPRTGPGTDSWEKAEKVWCSVNRNDALTRAKRGENVKAAQCPADVVARDYDLGHKFAVRGTPSIILANGEMLGGYVPPTELAQHLKTIK
jgi:thiol:disulfide interchange protein DsbC